jgi:hypothetical protein
MTPRGRLDADWWTDFCQMMRWMAAAFVLAAFLLLLIFGA